MSESEISSDGGVSSATVTEFECPSCESVVEARYRGNDGGRRAFRPRCRLGVYRV